MDCWTCYAWPSPPAVGAFLGLFVTVGFVVSGGPPNLVGRDGTSVAIGTWIQMLGVLTALVAGAGQLDGDLKGDRGRTALGPVENI